MKKLLAIALSCAALNASADVFEKLKSTPASKYDIGVIQLGLVALVLNDKMEGKPVRDSDFTISQVTLIDGNQGLGFTMSIVGKAKDLTQDICQKERLKFSESFNTLSLLKEVWPMLSDSEIKEINDRFILRTELISEENSSLKINCS